MKSIYVMLTILFMGASSMVFASGTSSSDTVKVWGNCGMCKSKIEKAAKQAGATAADWNKDTKILVVSYDASKTSLMDIEQKIAETGYDTQDIRANDAAYKKLDECCQYDRKDASATNTTTVKCCGDNEKCVQGGCCKKDMSCCKKDASGACCKDGKCSGMK